ncbi:hypothetical protein AMAG_07297 [Allomyces macrogynus ATCC 38327]|uniref:F-box domain-containing protein n=1 Tax=Allomyces macrogynus (strain ATCC 38327) TaxID=578462 RepID=A0A0L0SHW7_ALLM3|nr:hypothetical protein AMAG_07297 [Allomyces macrogynus ATCC 38327]|eukprot:KNE62039.1 hypothetical protein AMAG_07297 [Allomyces macrogynus ATCC 38327]
MAVPPSSLLNQTHRKLHLLDFSNDILSLIAEHVADIRGSIHENNKLNGQSRASVDNNDYNNSFDDSDDDDSHTTDIPKHDFVPVGSSLARSLLMLRTTCTTWHRVVSSILRWHLTLDLDIAWDRAVPWPTYYRFVIAPPDFGPTGIAWSPELFLEERPAANELTPIRNAISPSTVECRNWSNINTDCVRSMCLKRSRRRGQYLAGANEDMRMLQVAHLGLSTILARMAARFRHLAVLQVDVLLPVTSLVLALAVLSPTLKVLSLTTKHDWNAAATMISLPHLRELYLAVQNVGHGNDALQALVTAPRLKELQYSAETIHPDLFDNHFFQFPGLEKLKVKGKLVNVNQVTRTSSGMPSVTAVAWSRLRSMIVPTDIYTRIASRPGKLTLPFLETLTVFGHAVVDIRLERPPWTRWSAMPHLTRVQLKLMVVSPLFLAELAWAAPHLVTLDVLQCSLQINSLEPHPHFTFSALQQLHIGGNDVIASFVATADAPALTALDIDLDALETPVPILPWPTIETLTLRSTSAWHSGDSILISGADLDALPRLATLNLQHSVSWIETGLPMLRTVQHLVAPAQIISDLAASQCPCNAETIETTDYDLLRAVPPYAPLRRVLTYVVHPAALALLSRFTTLTDVRLRSVAAPVTGPLSLILEYRSQNPLWRELPGIEAEAQFARALDVHIMSVDDPAEAASEIIAVVQWAAGLKVVYPGPLDLGFRYHGARQTRPAEWTCKWSVRKPFPVALHVGNNTPLRDLLLTAFDTRLDLTSVSAKFT